jgi:hypothetical protein
MPQIHDRDRPDDYQRGRGSMDKLRRQELGGSREHD